MPVPIQKEKWMSWPGTHAHIVWQFRPTSASGSTEDLTLLLRPSTGGLEWPSSIHCTSLVIRGPDVCSNVAAALRHKSAPSMNLNRRWCLPPRPPWIICFRTSNWNWVFLVEDVSPAKDIWSSFALCFRPSFSSIRSRQPNWQHRFWSGRVSKATTGLSFPDGSSTSLLLSAAIFEPKLLPLETLLQQHF